MAAARLLALAAFLGAAAAAEDVVNGTATAASVTAPSGPGGSNQGLVPGPAAAGAATTAPPGSSSSSGLFGLGLPALQRAFFVFLALACLALLYYLGGRVFRARKPPRKKYGLLSNSEDNVEMGSLESDEDTLFETRNLRR